MLVSNAFPDISEGLNLTIFPGSMPPEPLRWLTLTPLKWTSRPQLQTCCAIQSQTTKAPPSFPREAPSASFGPSPRRTAPPRKKPGYGPVTWHTFQLSGLQDIIKLLFLFSKGIFVSLFKNPFLILLIGLCRDLRISCNSWFYFLFDMICMSLDMICILKRAINFHPSISIKANGITSHFSGQPRTVTSSHKYAAPKKDEKANHFWSNYFKV